MFKLEARLNRSRSMMLSLYSLSFFALGSSLVFLVSLFYHLITRVEWSQRQRLGQLLLESLGYISVAMFWSIPLAVGLTYLAVTWSNTRYALGFSEVLHFVDRTPALILGVVFLYFSFLQPLYLILVYVLLAVSQLSRRWIRLSSRVRSLDIDCMLSLGHNVVGVTLTLYMRQFLFHYLGHLVAVFCNLFVIVTPVFFLKSYAVSSSVLGLKMYHWLGRDSGAAALFALTVVIFHSLRVFLDRKTSYLEVEFG